MRSWEEVEAFALSLPGTDRGTSWRVPAVKVGPKAFVSTGHEAGSFHVRCPHGEKTVLLETGPNSFWQTPHYANWPGLLARYDATDPDRVRIVVERAWWDAAPVRLRRSFGDRP